LTQENNERVHDYAGPALDKQFQDYANMAEGFITPEKVEEYQIHRYMQEQADLRALALVNQRAEFARADFANGFFGELGRMYANRSHYLQFHDVVPQEIDQGIILARQVYEQVLKFLTEELDESIRNRANTSGEQPGSN
jgi:hypothetical protein